MDSHRPPTNGSEWPQARIDHLTALWGEGMTASQIAASMPGTTKNSIIGKLNRLGLHSTAQPNRPIGVPTRRRSQAIIAGLNFKRKAAQKAPQQQDRPAAPVLVEIDIIIPVGQRCTLLQLDQEKCHWPVGDPQHPDFYFCGGPVDHGSYCPAHARVAYQPPAARHTRSPFRLGQRFA